MIQLEHGKLYQIKSHDENSLELIPIWTTNFEAKDSPRVLDFFKRTLPAETVPLSHLRRIVQIENTHPQQLKLAICSHQCVASQSAMECLIEQLNEAHKLTCVLQVAHASRYQASTKQEAAQWSRESWPIMWRGNPGAQGTTLTDDEKTQISKYLSFICTSPTCDPPIRTMIVDPVKDALVVTADDTRVQSGNPLNHSIMHAIHDVARMERQRREQVGQTSRQSSQGYLCLNLHVYTTHEPCCMCAMALVHSRVARLFYVKSSRRAGAIEATSGCGYGVHWTKELNWRYEAFRYDPDSCALENVDIAC